MSKEPHAGDWVRVVRPLARVEREVAGEAFCVIRIARPHGFVVVADGRAPYGERHLMPEGVERVEPCCDCGDVRGDGHPGCAAWDDGGLCSGGCVT